MNIGLWQRDRNALTDWREEWIKENKRSEKLKKELSAYRASGLTPADLPRAAELVKTDDKGLCVVLNEPRKPLILDDDREAVRCPYCGIDLMGIPYGDRILLQCPECGEYVDGTKAITRAEAEAALDDK